MEFLKDLSIDKVRNLAEDVFNQAKPKTDVEARVYEVLSHKNWGSSSSLMHEVARDTFDVERFHVVTRLMWEGMENQRPAAWRIVFKALTLLEFLVKNGAERCVDDARNHGHVLRALGQFNYYEGTIDRGLGVREKSKQIMEILGDDERIREERQKARKLRQKFGSGGAVASSTAGGQNAGYGNQESWNSGGGYGQGGVDSSSPYESGGGYSGRYAGSRDGESAPTSTAPTFAAIPDNKPKKIKKKKKKPENESNAQAPAPAAAEVDLFSFDDPSPAAAPATIHSNEDFGAFQTTPAPAADDDFGAFVASKASQSDPFATPAPAPMASSFDAFGNNSTFPQNNGMAGNMQNMATAFGNMTVGQTQQMPAPTATEDDFGDFADAAPKSPPVLNSKPSDPLAKLVSLDGLSKNPRNNAPNQNANKGLNFGGMGNMGMGNMGGMNPQNMNMNMNPGMNMNMNPNVQTVPNVVSAGGRDAISSLMGPAPVGVPQGMGMGMQPQFAQQHPQQVAMNPQMMQQGGVQSMNPNMMGNQMAGMQTNMMGNQMHNPMQQSNMMGGMNPNMMGGQMMGNMMAPMQGNMMGGQQAHGMQGNMMGGMPGNMQGNMMSGQMGSQQWR